MPSASSCRIYSANGRPTVEVALDTKSLQRTVHTRPQKPCPGSDSQGFARIKPSDMSRLRISTISFLNTVPLMWDFEHGPRGSDFNVSYTVPSACAAELLSGAADIGIIPAAAYAQIPDLAIIPGVAIAARRAVRSILLVSKVPLEKIQTVALDTSSMTSVALTKVLFERCSVRDRRFTSMAPDVDRMLREHDAGLLIGDTALQVDRSRYLALIWRKNGFASRASRLCSRYGRFGALRWRMLRPIWLAFSRPRGITALQAENVDFIARGVGRAGGTLQSRSAHLPHRKHSLPPGCGLPGRPSAVLSLCCGVRSFAPGSGSPVSGSREVLRPPSRLMMSSILDRVEGLQ